MRRCLAGKEAKLYLCSALASYYSTQNSHILNSRQIREGSDQVHNRLSEDQL